MSNNPHRWHVWLLLLLSLVFYLPGIAAPRDFWVADEARYAEVVREMIHDGHWLVPHLNGQFYPDKPPLYFWLAAGVSLAAGAIKPWTFMAVTWAATAGCVLATYGLGAAMLGPEAAFLAGVVLISTFLFMLCAEIVRMDMLLTCFVALALYAFFIGQRRDQRGGYAWFYLCSGLAVLSKGPLGAAFTLVPAVLWLTVRRDGRGLRRLLLHGGWLAFAAAAGGWLAAAWLTGHRDFIADIFRKQIAGRAVRASSHPEPFYFYVLLLPAVLLPWTPFAARAVRELWVRRPAGAGLLLWWFAGGLAIISAVSGKLFIYLLPLLPPAALALGGFLQRRLERNPADRPALRLESALAVGLTFGLLAALPLGARWFPAEWRSLPLLPLSAMLLALLLAGLALSATGRVRAVLALLVAGQWLFSAYAFQVLAPAADPLCSARGLAAAVAAHEGESEIATFGVQRGILNFYLGRPVRELTVAELAAYPLRPGDFLVISEKEFKRHGDKLPPGREVLGRHFIVDRAYLLVQGEEREQGAQVAGERSQVSGRKPE